MAQRRSKGTTHRVAGVGLCPVCRHYGADCCGTAPAASLADIAAILSGHEWDADTVDHIAAVVRMAGYQLAEPGTR